jgi:hypothetical protein
VTLINRYPPALESQHGYFVRNINMLPCILSEEHEITPHQKRHDTLRRAIEEVITVS